MNQDLTLRTCVVGLLLLSSFISAQYYDEINDVCLQCLCEASTGCQPASARDCTDSACGVFQITEGYWMDAGRHSKFVIRPGALGTGSFARQDFISCVTDMECATTTVKAYMAKFAQDCNLDGVIDCQDYARIHLQGGFSCWSPIPRAFQTKLNQCLSQYNAHSLNTV